MIVQHNTIHVYQLLKERVHTVDDTMETKLVDNRANNARLDLTTSNDAGCALAHGKMQQTIPTFALSDLEVAVTTIFLPFNPASATSIAARTCPTRNAHGLILFRILTMDTDHVPAQIVLAAE